MAPNDASALLDYSPRPENARLVREEPEVEHIISHNLNDIYLLLDHLSGRADSSVAGIEVDYEGHKQNIVDAVCKIGWLARKGQAQWEEAAVLFKARDKLNQRSAPATGLTIAYTLLVAPIPITNGFLRLFSFLRRRDCGEGYPHSIARKAYPHLIYSAIRCRKWIDHLPRIMFLALVLTSLLSWYVGYGKFILLRIEQLNSQRAEIARALDLVEGPQPTTNSNKDRGSASEAWLQDEQHLAVRCDSRKGRQVSAARARACFAVDELERKRLAADEALTEWTSYAIWLPYSAAKFAALLGGPVPNPMDYKLTAPEREEQWSANLLGVLGNYVLPMMYGFLGASVAAIMNLKQKIRSSRLSPRERRMNHVQLVLGVITGACIGLFLTASGAGTSDTALSGTSVPLSASALSFLAGFGVEGVFKKLENIMITVFGGQQSAPASGSAR